MTKDELLNVPVEEKEKKIKKEVSDDALLSTFPTSEKKSEEVTSKVESKSEPETVEVETEPTSEVKNAVDADGDFFIDDDPGLFAKEIKEKSEQEAIQKSQEDGKNVELANNIVKESKIVENSNLPTDVKPYLEIIKEKLKGAGKAVMNVLEMVGELVENLFKKKN